MCTPSTGPISPTQTGSLPNTSRHASARRAAWSGDWMCCTTQASAASACRSWANRTMRSNALALVRTRSSGTISLCTLRIGLIFSVEPIQALAPPIRPPRFRYSSVSIANHRPRFSRVSRAARSTASRSAPCSAARAAASAISPSPPAAVAESTTRTRPGSRPPSRSSASTACRAASLVPDKPPEMWIETMSRPASSSGSYTARKSPTAGCDVVGSASLPRSSS